MLLRAADRHGEAPPGAAREGARHVKLLVLAAIVFALDRPADACSPGPGFMPPTNYELAATSKRIVIAKAVGANKAKDLGDSGIEVEVTAVLKGTGKVGEKLPVRGSTIGYMGASPKNDFSRARKGAYAGSCTAYDYKLGRHYLLFLVEDEDKWDTRGDPFTRVNEEVDPKDDPWTIAVKKYIEIAALPKLADRRKAFEALIARGKQAKATATDKAISDDIATHIARPTPYKSFAELDEMYRLATPDERNAIVEAIGGTGDVAARGFMKDLVAAVRAGTTPIARDIALEAIGTYYQKVADPPVLTQVAELYVALGSKAKQARWELMWLLIRRADASHVNVMERALAGADDEEAGRLVEWFAKAPSESARKNIAKRVAGAYREKWELAIGLAGLGDKDVIAWAGKLLAAPPPKGGDDRRFVATYAIAMSPLPEADALVPKVIANGGEDLVTLIQGYQKAAHANADRRLAEIAKLPKLSADAKEWLDRTIKSRASGTN
jgi:hypothetical protein